MRGSRGQPSRGNGAAHGLRGIVADEKGQGVATVVEGRRSRQVIAQTVDRPFNRVNTKYSIGIRMFIMQAKNVNGKLCLRRAGEILFYSHIKQGV